MFAKIIFLCSALAAVHGSAFIAAPLVNTGVSVESRQQDSLGNYAYAYDIKDAATGSINSKAEVGKAVTVAAPLAYAAPVYGAHAYASPLAYATPAVAAPVAYGGALGHARVLGLGHGAAYGLGYGAGLISVGHGKLLI